MWLQASYQANSLGLNHGALHPSCICGMHRHLPETGQGQGPSIVLGLAKQAVPSVYIFYTSLNLCHEMTKHVYARLGILKQYVCVDNASINLNKLCFVYFLFFSLRWMYVEKCIILGRAAVGFRV